MTDPDMPVIDPDSGPGSVREIMTFAKENPLILIRLAIFAVMMVIAAPFLWIAMWVLPDEEPQ